MNLQAHLRIEASRHYPNEFCVLVGTSGKGRKGSSWDHIEAILAAADPDLISERLVSGLSSGEGLIAAVRDPTDTTQTVATLWRNGTATALGVLAGDQFSRPVAMNDADDVLVNSINADGSQHPFLWRAGKTYPLPVPAGYASIHAVGLNSAGQVVGYGVPAGGSSTTGTRTIVWTPAT